MTIVISRLLVTLLFIFSLLAPSMLKSPSSIAYDFNIEECEDLTEEDLKLKSDDFKVESLMVRFFKSITYPAYLALISQFIFFTDPKPPRF